MVGMEGGVHMLLLEVYHGAPGGGIKYVQNRCHMGPHTWFLQTKIVSI